MADSRPVIGDFRSKPVNPPRGSMMPDFVNTPAPKAPPAPEPATADSDVKEAAEDIEKAFETELTLAEKYRKRLEEAKISLTVANAIYDAVLDKGFYEEYVRIRTNRAVFRTRTYDDQLRLQTALETFQPRMAHSHDELVARYNLAASLFEWQGKAYKHDTEAEFEAVLQLIRKMPQPVVSMLYDALMKFDQKIMLVFSEGATDSF